ncbi:YveK family protein [Vagococcus silagei]|uniref:Capsular polysaccharide biosynthesis protein CpsC n=1 Tax=Vagococcus silagei TaxID=2508885 RepID=A0A4S3B179_9ENTE|nr:Wzz/FepE/Etk N-terminal domain-containing protein [Vagococcus silagei]THB60168.1 tyrosine protein kinase [Vagococcus silagei]
MEETISLQDVFKLLKQKILFVLTAMLLGLGVSAVLTFFVITPKYSATTQLIATMPASDNLNADSINTNLMMINTYKDFISGNVVTEEASEKLADKTSFKRTAPEIKEMVTVEQTQNSQMFSINVKSENPTEAAQLANIVAEIFQKEAKKYTNVDKVSIISEADRPDSPVSPNKLLNLAIGAVLGIIVGVGLAFLSELLNRTIKSENYIVEELGLPILGVIPKLERKEIVTYRKEQERAFKLGDFYVEEDAYSMNNDLVDGLEQEANDLSSTSFERDFQTPNYFSENQEFSSEDFEKYRD